MGSATVRNLADSYVRQSTPNKNYGLSNRLYVGTGFYSYLYFGNPAPLKGKIVSAKLVFFSAGTWAGSVTPGVQLLNGKWSANKVNWNNDPGGTGAVANPAAKVGATNGTRWEVDITSQMQSVSNGTKWFGFKLTANGAAQKGVYSMQAVASRRPYVQITWSDNPLAPADLVPRNGQAIGTQTPTFSWDFMDVSGNRSQSSYRIQIDNDNAFTSIMYDSGTIPSSKPEFNLADRINDILNPAMTVDASTWANVTNATVTRSTAQFRSSPASLSLASVAAGDMRAGNTDFAVTGGLTYVANGFVRSAVSARSTRLEILWKDANGVTLSTAVGANVTSSTAAFTTALPSLSAVAPATAVTASLRVVVVATAAAAEVHYFDDLSMSVFPLFDSSLLFVPGATYYWRVITTDGAGLPSPWSSIETFKYVAPPVVTITAPAASPNNFVKEVTPLLGWSFTGTQTAYQVLLYNDLPSNDKLLWDSGKVDSGNTYATVPANKIVKTVAGAITYRLVVRVWDDQVRATVPGFPAYQSAERQFTLQFDPAVGAVTSISAASDAYGLATNLTVFRTTPPDYFTLMRDNDIIATNLIPIDYQDAVDPTKYVIPDFAPGRRSVTWTVGCVVNGATSQANPTANTTISRKLSWICGVEGDYPVGFMNPDHSLEDGEVSEVMQAQDGPPILVTQNLFGEQGSFAGRLVDLAPTMGIALTARTMKDNLRYIRDAMGGKCRLVFQDESMVVFIHHLKIHRVGMSGNGTDYEVEFDFFQVGN